MHVHNIMEEYVEKHVNALYEQLKKAGTTWLSCDCENCRLDAISYVLNRVAPHYTVSGRGAVYTAQILENAQLKADVNALSMEAIRIISSVQRPYHKTEDTNSENIERFNGSPVFNFPVISGAVYDGDAFAPVSDAKVTLYGANGQIVKMHDVSWQNPTGTFQSTKGSFSFWPETIKAVSRNETRKFSFVIEASKEGYSSIKHGFEIVLMSDDKPVTNISQSVTMKIKDLIFFKE